MPSRILALVAIAGCSAPARVASPSERRGDPPVEIVAGALHTCARTAGGAVACWGGGRTRPTPVAAMIPIPVTAIRLIVTDG